jgi:type II secretory pathway pseudopilin PulG
VRARKTILTAVTAGAFLLPLAIAAPASADPGPRPLCENHVNCDAGNRDLIRVNVGIGNGGNCDQDRLLLVQVRIDAGRRDQQVSDAQREDRNAREALRTAQNTYDSAVAGFHATPPTATQGDVNLAKNRLDAAQTRANTARRHLDEVRESGRLLDAKIALLTDRIHGSECATPAPLPVPVPAPVDTPDQPPAPVTDQPAPPTVINNGPIVVTPPSNPQVGEVPSGPAPTGGGALRDQIS